MVGSTKHAPGQPARGNLQIHVSKLLLGCSIGAIAATAGLIVAGITSAARPRPPRGPVGEMPPPPPPSDALIISIGLFVLDATLGSGSRRLISLCKLLRNDR